MNLYNNFRKKLEEAVAIKSVSTDKTYQNDIQKMAEWCNKQLSSIGFQTEIINGYGNPVVFGSLKINSTYPTVLHYGHYDVQPASIDEGWHNDPFKIYEENDRLYARGVVDNKGQFLIYLTVLEYLINSKKLRYNVKFILEGNEETGSAGIPKLLLKYKNKLAADFALISDGEIINKQPTITLSYRGSVNIEIKVYGPKTDLHSGIYGGLVYNPGNVLANLLAKMADGYGNTNIMDSQLNNISSEDLKNLQSNEFDFSEFKEITGFNTPPNMDSVDVYKSLGFANTIQITGIKCGYTGEGFRNSIASGAVAKLNIRCHPNVNPEDVVRSISRFVEKTLPKDIKFSVLSDDFAHGSTSSADNKYVQKAADILERVYSNKVFYNYCGATIPIAYDFANTLRIPAVFVDMANSDCNMHGPNENFKIDLIKKGLEFAAEFLSE